MAPETLIGADRPSSVRVGRAGGEPLVLRSPAFVNDSVVAMAAGRDGDRRVGAGLGAGAFVGARAGVPWQDVLSLEVEQLSVWRTVGLVAGVVLISAGWAAIVGDAGGERPPPDVPLPKLRAGLR